MCELGHTWTAGIGQRAGKEATGCPYCAGKKVLPGFNDLATKFPAVASEAVGWDPSTVTAFSKQVRQWRCPLGHNYTMAIGNRTGQHQGCPYCSGNKVLAGFNDLATKFPTVASEAVSWNPSTVTAFSKQVKQWRCPLGHNYTMAIGNRTGQNQNCSVCAGKRVLAGFNDLATHRPDIASQAVGWDPTRVVLNSNKQARWRCLFGHEWLTSPNARVSNDTGCPYCAGNKVLAGFNDLATKFPAIAAEAVDWDPSTVSAKSNRKRRWRCNNGHEWTSSVGSRTGLGAGCPTCSTTGFDPGKNGWLYLVRQELWGLLQIGISNVPRKRVGQHLAAGWTIVEVAGPMPGAKAYQTEQDILRALRLRGVHLGPKEIGGKFSGYTEAWIEEEFPVRSLRELTTLIQAIDAR